MFIYIALFAVVWVLYYTSYIRETYHTFNNNYQRLKLLKNNVAPDMDISCYKLVIGAAKTVFFLMSLYFSQNWNKTVKKIGFDKYEISYVIKGRLYKLRVKPTKMPKILQVIDENDEDITEDLLPYFGPDEKFHGTIYKPIDFRRKMLTFNMADGNVFDFEEKDDIVLSKIKNEK